MACAAWACPKACPTATAEIQEARRYNKTMSVGRMLITIGVVLLAVGLLVTLGERLPLRIGKLPGDIVVRGKNSVFYFPLVTCLLLSVVLSLVLWLFSRR